MVSIRESLENSDILIVEDDPINLRMLRVGTGFMVQQLVSKPSRRLITFSRILSF